MQPLVDYLANVQTHQFNDTHNNDMKLAHEKIMMMASAIYGQFNRNMITIHRHRQLKESRLELGC